MTKPSQSRLLHLLSYRDDAEIDGAYSVVGYFVLYRYTYRPPQHPHYALIVQKRHSAEVNTTVHLYCYNNTSNNKKWQCAKIVIKRIRIRAVRLYKIHANNREEYEVEDNDHTIPYVHPVLVLRVHRSHHPCQEEHRVRHLLEGQAYPDFRRDRDSRLAQVDLEVP
ncbi:hypothetical protein NECAME_01885 [Necator americanus]|uniref:Uncharacterized protein n=1 Tax=Necator americanus TaxID=51031 RepID=W2TLU6_NECAM|nr:hypothetical protein NECAME_01885 [Necator americanus]ETN83085.1 hypothetical protein NECAME_01885 [Necator americanus]